MARLLKERWSVVVRPNLPVIARSFSDEAIQLLTTRLPRPLRGLAMTPNGKLNYYSIGPLQFQKPAEGEGSVARLLKERWRRRRALSWAGGR